MLRVLFGRLLDFAVALFNRNPWTNRRVELIPRTDFDEDGLRSKHAHSFVDDPGFQRAYGRAVRAAGWDYEVRWRTHVVLWAARLAASHAGAFVECGTGRGFMASAICEDQHWSDRPFYLVDTFDSRWRSGDHAGQVSPYYATSVDDVSGNFAEWPGVRLVVGEIPDVLLDVPDGPVAFLHVDLNAADPEEAAVEHFWPRLVPSGVIVFDDYGWKTYEESKERVDMLAAKLGFDVLMLPTGQGLAIKR